MLYFEAGIIDNIGVFLIKKVKSIYNDEFKQKSNISGYGICPGS